MRVIKEFACHYTFPPPATPICTSIKYIIDWKFPRCKFMKKKIALIRRMTDYMKSIADKVSCHIYIVYNFLFFTISLRMKSSRLFTQRRGFFFNFRIHRVMQADCSIVNII